MSNMILSARISLISETHSEFTSLSKQIVYWQDTMSSPRPSVEFLVYTETFDESVRLIVFARTSYRNPQSHWRLPFDKTYIESISSSTRHTDVVKTLCRHLQVMPAWAIRHDYRSLARLTSKQNFHRMSHCRQDSCLSPRHFSEHLEITWRLFSAIHETFTVTFHRASKASPKRSVGKTQDFFWDISPRPESYTDEINCCLEFFRSPKDHAEHKESQR